MFQTIRSDIDARFNSCYQHSLRTAMHYFYLFKMLGFLSCWTLICWFFFAGKKNISDQVKVVHYILNVFSPKKCFFPLQVYEISEGILSRQELGLRQQMVLKIDKSRRLNETSLVPLIQPFMPNVPLQLWEENKKEQWFSKSSCGR